jgi:hypothetical protein
MMEAARVLRLYVGQEVTYARPGASSKSLRGVVERVDDRQSPAMVTVRMTDGCKGCRTTGPEDWFQPVPKVLRMIPPRGSITRLVTEAGARPARISPENES